MGIVLRIRGGGGGSFLVCPRRAKASEILFPLSTLHCPLPEDQIFHLRDLPSLCLVLNLAPFSFSLAVEPFFPSHTPQDTLLEKTYEACTKRVTCIRGIPRSYTLFILFFFIKALFFTWNTLRFIKLSVWLVKRGLQPAEHNIISCGNSTFDPPHQQIFMYIHFTQIINNNKNKCKFFF